MSSDVDFWRLYLFKKLKGCCKQWFISWDVDGCVNSVIQGKHDEVPCPESRPECNHTSSVTNVMEVLRGMWYPNLDEYMCKHVSQIPSWVLDEGYTVYYLFNTKAVLLRVDVNHQVEIIVEVFLHREYFHMHLRTVLPTNVDQMYSRKCLLVQIL